MLRMEEDIDMGADLQRRIGLQRIRKHADAVMLAMEPTPIYRAVVAELGEPPLVQR